MGRIEIPPSTAFHLINHGPCPVITTGDGTLRNAAPVNWTMPVNDDPPLIVAAVEDGIRTAELIEKSGAFCVNVVGESFGPRLLALGQCSGRDSDKFAKFSLAPVPCRRIPAPRLAEGLGHLECRLRARHPHDGVTLYVGEVVHAEAEASCWDGKSLIPERAKTLHHLAGGRFAVTREGQTIAPSPIPPSPPEA